MEKINGQLALLSFGKIRDDWSYEDSAGLILGSDPSYLKDSRLHRIGVIFSVDENDNPDGKIKTLVYDGKLVLGGLQELSESHFPDVLFSWEKNVILEILRKSSVAESIEFEDVNVAESSEGEGGEVRVSGDNSARASGAMALCVSYFPTDEYSVDLSLPYGIETTGKDAEEYRDYGCVVFKPDPETVGQDAKEALEYFTENNSPIVAIDVIKKWRTIDVEPLAELWGKILVSLSTDKYPPAHVWAARVARYTVNDEVLYISIIKNLLDKAEAWGDVYIQAAIEGTGELFLNGLIARDEVVAIIEKAVDRVSLEDPSQLQSLIEHVSSEESGLKWGDKQFAAGLLQKVLMKINDKKIIAKYKKYISVE